MTRHSPGCPETTDPGLRLDPGWFAMRIRDRNEPPVPLGQILHHLRAVILVVRFEILSAEPFSSTAIELKLEQEKSMRESASHS